MIVKGWKAQFKKPGKPVQVFTSRDTAWEDLPNEGAQTFMIYYEEEYAPGKCYRDFMGGHDYYYIEGDPLEQDSFKQNNTFKLGDPTLKIGTLIPQKEYEDLVKTTMNDKIF